MDREDRVAAIVLAAQHLARLGALDVGLQLLQPPEQVVLHGLAGLGPLDEHPEIVDTALQGVAERQLLLQTPAPLQQLLRLGLILPEVRFGDARLDARELGAMTRRVKDSSADRRTASPGRGSV